MGAGERLLVFVKYPAPGEVKTRLAKTVGTDAAAALYRCFVSDTLATVRQTGYPALVYFYPADAKGVVASWLGDGVTCLPQQGCDLGERMFAAFQEAFRDGSRAVLIGTDCPDLPERIIHEAFGCLTTKDAVLGPARDGGYYLIGFSAAGIRKDLFEGIEWGGGGVFDTTLSILQTCGIRTHLLPSWRDIDMVDDLKDFYDRQKRGPAGSLSTVDYLRDRLGW